MQSLSLHSRSDRKWALAFAALLAGAACAQAQSADALIDKLVDKGILTVDEAKGLREESDKDFTRAYAVKSGMPDWVTSFKINGDVRGRFESFIANNPAFVDRNRFRYRLRAGFTAVLQDDFELGFRFTSSEAAGTFGGDPISGNTTMQNNGSKKFVYLDTAYAKWTPLHTREWNGGIILGKMENPFVFSDIVFDQDYTPEGLAQTIGYNFGSDHALRLTAGEFVLDEIGGNGRDPWLFGGQARFDSTWTTKLSSSFGVSFLDIEHIDQLTSASVPDQNVGNLRSTSVSGTTVVLGAPVYHYNPFILDGAATYLLDSAPLYTGPFPVKVFGTYMYNPAAPSGDNTGFDAGITFGKAGKRKTWELTYKYKYLEGDAWWEELVDSDSGAFYANAVATVPPPPAALRAAGAGYGAGTNIRGHVVKFGYSPYDHFQINLSWFGLELIHPYQSGTDSWMNRMQADLVFKF